MEYRSIWRKSWINPPVYCIILKGFNSNMIILAEIVLQSSCIHGIPVSYLELFPVQISYSLAQVTVWSRKQTKLFREFVDLLIYKTSWKNKFTSLRDRSCAWVLMKYTSRGPLKVMCCVWVGLSWHLHLLYTRSNRTNQTPATHPHTYYNDIHNID